jgi:hypothetical protein
LKTLRSEELEPWHPTNINPEAAKAPMSQDILFINFIPLKRTPDSRGIGKISKKL